MFTNINIVYDREMGLYHLRMLPKRPDNLTALEDIQYYRSPTVITLTLNDLTVLRDQIADALKR